MIFDPLRSTTTEMVSLGSRRSRKSSFRFLPHARRGITLKELKDFYETERTWIEELRWRCNHCRRSAVGTEGPCSHCDATTGVLQMRNLYEVCEVMIKPACQERGISYVEQLDASRPESGVNVETFVSHWWGEEFPRFIKTLETYARWRCASTCHWWRGLFAGIVISTVFPFLFGKVANCNKSDLIEEPKFFDVLKEASCRYWSCVNVLATSLTTAFVTWIIRMRMRDHDSWSFWICAFSNNQFAIQHAMAQDGDVSTSSFALAMRSGTCSDVLAIVDKECVIYSRIWCAFELFYASTVMPQCFERKLRILLANEHGVLSDGDAAKHHVVQLQTVIKDLRTADATATVAADRQLIQEAMERERITHEDLDEVLQDLCQAGLDAVAARRWMPFVAFFCLPLAVRGFADAAFRAVVMISNIVGFAADGEGFYISECILHDEPWPGCRMAVVRGLFGLCLGIPACVATCCLTRRLRAVKGYLKWIVKLVAYWATSPALYLIEVIANAACSYYWWFHYCLRCETCSEWTRHSVDNLQFAAQSNLLLSFLGGVVGILFYLVRDWPSVTPLRRQLEWLILTHEGPLECRVQSKKGSRAGSIASSRMSRGSSRTTARSRLDT